MCVCAFVEDVVVGFWGTGSERLPVMSSFASIGLGAENLLLRLLYPLPN